LFLSLALLWLATDLLDLADRQPGRIIAPEYDRFIRRKGASP